MEAGSELRYDSSQPKGSDGKWRSSGGGTAPKKSLDKSAESGIIEESDSKVELGLQYFAEKDIARQDSNSLKRAIGKYRKQIDIHSDKI